jgi:hypothetical protein
VEIRRGYVGQRTTDNGQRRAVAGGATPRQLVNKTTRLLLRKTTSQQDYETFASQDYKTTSQRDNEWAVAGGASQGLRLTTKQRVNKTTSGAATDS